MGDLIVPQKYKDPREAADRHKLSAPPIGLTPADTRGWFPWNPKYNIRHGEWIPDPDTRNERWNKEYRALYEKRMEWFYKAKYGLFYHFLAYGDRSLHANNGFTFSEEDWSSERWNQIVESIDVEKAADQAEELGAGYVGITLGQNHRYACAPNPVIDALWGLKPGQYNSFRDLPMDLGKALARRRISLMIYCVGDAQYRLPVPDSKSPEDCKEDWIKVMQWYSDHYGSLCRSWWMDGLHPVESDPRGVEYEYSFRLIQAMRHGNPEALVGCSHYQYSDFTHGHCIGGQWEKQRINCRPYFGRWDPDFKIQWHAFQYIGSYWGDTDTALKTDELVEYVTDIIRRGGVFTFDVGSFQIVNGKTQPCLEIPEGQWEQICAVRDSLR
ncbi:MAG TPA: hypothetical protein DCY35_12180 [Prolixibacteraceae bacterium]|nr:hypothetical protein [Prolixibacteraceae bacterium]